MSAEQTVLLVVGLVVIAAVAVTVAYATAHARRREPRSGGAHLPWPGLRDHDDVLTDATEPTTMTPTAWPDAAAGRPGGGQAPSPRPSSSLISPTSVRQVARVVAFLYLASSAVVVALTRAWPDTEPAIFTLLALGTLLVVLFMDLVPPTALGHWRRPGEAIGAIIFVGLLTALTGGASSPFFVGFFLVVAGTALSTEGRAPLAIALLAAATLALVGIVDALGSPLEPVAVAWLGFNAVALILLADIATAAARAQRHARDEALRASRFDALTGLYNRGFFFTTMEQEIRRSERMDRGFAMLMLDLDDLKPVNDRFGHQWGDRLLRAVAETIRRTIRFTDSAARYGGDEFVVLLPETDAAGGYVVGEKLRRDIAAVALHAADRVVRSSVSVGLVTYPDDGTTIEQLVAAADVAMYESKRRGKNRIVGYQTRLERVATAIEVEAGAASPALMPVGEVRTGGDPAPWGAVPGPVASAEPPLPRPSSRGPRLPDAWGARPPEPRAATPDARAGSSDAGPPPPQARPGPPESRSVPPGSGAAPPESSSPPPGSRTAPAESSSAQPGPGGAQPGSGAAPPDTSFAATDMPPGAPDARPGPPEARRKGETSGPSTELTDPPWLTRTDDSLIRPTSPSGAPSPAPDSRPTGKRDPSSDSERISRPGDRPWIVLPIEPDEPPEGPPA